MGTRERADGQKQEAKDRAGRESRESDSKGATSWAGQMSGSPAARSASMSAFRLPWYRCPCGRCQCTPSRPACCARCASTWPSRLAAAEHDADVPAAVRPSRRAGSIVLQGGCPGNVAG